MLPKNEKGENIMIISDNLLLYFKHNEVHLIDVSTGCEYNIYDH